MKRHLFALCAAAGMSAALPAAALDLTGSLPGGGSFLLDPNTEYAISFTLSAPADGQIVIYDTDDYTVYDKRTGTILDSDDGLGVYGYNWTNVMSGSMLFQTSGYYTIPDPICLGCEDIYDHSYYADFSFTGAPPGTYDLTIDRLGDAPEPAEWALLLAGFGTLGAALRRRRAAIG